MQIHSLLCMPLTSAVRYIFYTFGCIEFEKSEKNWHQNGRQTRARLNCSYPTLTKITNDGPKCLHFGILWNVRRHNDHTNLSLILTHNRFNSVIWIIQKHSNRLRCFFVVCGNIVRSHHSLYQIIFFLTFSHEFVSFCGVSSLPLFLLFFFVSMSYFQIFDCMLYGFLDLARIEFTYCSADVIWIIRLRIAMNAGNFFLKWIFTHTAERFFVSKMNANRNQRMLLLSLLLSNYLST